MRCKVNFQSDPISLVIIAADGKEHTFLGTIGDGGFVEVEIAAQQVVAADPPSALPNAAPKTESAGG